MSVAPTLSLAVCWLLAASATLADRAEIAITKAACDGREVPLQASSRSPGGERPQPLTLPSSVHAFAFHFESGVNAPEPSRLKYKLEGADAQWRDTSAEMVVWLRMLDRDWNVLAGNELVLTGESPGWNGHPEDAPLTQKTVTLVMPCQARRLCAFFISNGGPSALGMMVIDDVRVTIEHKDGSPPQTLAFDCQSGTGMDQALGVPSRWIREGPRPDLTQLLRRAEPPGHTALLLNDTDPRKYGVWRTAEVSAPVEPGDRLTLSCSLAYSIGKGGPCVARYGPLRPGAYWLRVAEVEPCGLPTGNEVSLPIQVRPPLLRRAEFWLIVSAAGGGLLLLAVRLLLWRRMQRRLSQSEHQRTLEAERARIARDIHDDLGATLAQIAMLSEMAEADAKLSRPIDGLLHDIFTRAHDTTRKLDEIVWALKPANDTLEHLIGYLSQFAENYLKLAGLRFRLDAPETLPACALTSGQRHNLFLAAKEALHNVVKHARATEVWLRVRVESGRLSLCIEDNGTGAVPEPDAPLSRGSANMRSRMEQIGGRFERSGRPGAGTAVELTLPLEGP